MHQILMHWSQRQRIGMIMMRWAALEKFDKETDDRGDNKGGQVWRLQLTRNRQNQHDILRQHSLHTELKGKEEK